jgi:hypothetical protein
MPREPETPYQTIHGRERLPYLVFEDSEHANESFA